MMAMIEDPSKFKSLVAFFEDQCIALARAQIRLGKLLQLDTKEIFTFVNWLIFAFYLHSRVSRGWRGRRAAWMAIAGFLVLLFNFLIVTVALSKTHSYF